MSKSWSMCWGSPTVSAAGVGTSAAAPPPPAAPAVVPLPDSPCPAPPEEEDAAAAAAAAPSSRLAAAASAALATPSYSSSVKKSGAAAGAGGAGGGGSLYRSTNDSSSFGGANGYRNGGGGGGGGSIGASSGSGLGGGSSGGYGNGGGGGGGAGSFDKDKYKNVKGIGSDMLFGARDDDPEEQTRRVMKVQEYSQSAAISSDMYFDRETPGSGAGGGYDGANGGVGIGDMAEQIAMSAAAEFQGAAEAANKLKVRACLWLLSMCLHVLFRLRLVVYVFCFRLVGALWVLFRGSVR